MSEKLTEAQVRLLERGFRAPRPGSNAFPLLSLREAGVPEIEGETIDAMVRSGFLAATPVEGVIETIKGGDGGPYGEIPDIDCTHSYRLTPSGRAALQAQEGKP